MKKYEYVNIDIDGILSAGTIEHRKIIDKYAANGYRFVGYIPTDITSHGKVTAIDLIFESEQ